MSGPHRILPGPFGGRPNDGGTAGSIEGATGLAADPQTPLAHKASHESGGSDEPSIAGLLGLAATPQYSEHRVIIDPSIGATAGNRYKTYAEADAALVALAGYQVDLFFIGNVTIPAGGPYRADGVAWRTDPSAPSTVTIADGATFTGLPYIIDRYMTVTGAPTSSPFTAPAGVRIFGILEVATFKSTSATALIDVGAGSTLVLFGASSSIYGDGTNPVVNLSAAGAVVQYTGFGNGCTLKPNSVAGVAGSTLQWVGGNAGASISTTHGAMSGNIASNYQGDGVLLEKYDHTGDSRTGASGNAQGAIKAIDAAAPNAHAASHVSGSDQVADLVGDSGSGGTHGLAPAPASGDAAADKYLGADAVWRRPVPEIIAFVSVTSQWTHSGDTNWTAITNGSLGSLTLLGSTTYRVSISGNFRTSQAAIAARIRAYDVDGAVTACAAKVTETGTDEWRQVCDLRVPGAGAREYRLEGKIDNGSQTVTVERAYIMLERLD